MTKPIFVVTHPRACSTAFERVFMTQRDSLKCIHEPFGDAFYYGPERLSERYEDDEEARIRSGFSESTFKTVFERIEREASEGKPVFIKDIIHYLVPPNGKPASIAPSLQRIKRGVGTGDVNGSHHASGVDGNGAHHKTKPYPYDTEPEPGNPTVVPLEMLSRFHFTFLIRDPHYSIPSYYRCTIPPLDEVTGFYNFDPSEAGYDEVRRVFEYMRKVRLVGPHVATRGLDTDIEGVEEVNCADGVDGVNGTAKEGVEICVVDADDLLDNPAAMIEAYCRSVGIEYTPDMLSWDSEEDRRFARQQFAKWRGFHEDAIESRGLTPRDRPKCTKTEEQFDAEWRDKFGEEGARVIRETVDRNMPDYLYMKKWAMRV
ncbi:P-loop containing nucleoside triphosphate hydrolase protein [Thermoascus aurantiacus ATCC 26904]